MSSSSSIAIPGSPIQVLRKSVKKGFEFTLMVVGASGLGKSTLLKSLFLMEVHPEHIKPGAIDTPNQTLELETSTVEMEERGVKLRINVIDTPGFGAALDNSKDVDVILSYIDEQHERYLHEETGLYRRHIFDTRIHCCFYFISPYGHGLKPLDIEFMKKLHTKVNIVPVIAKADCLTQDEIACLKSRVIQELKDHDIKIYQPKFDADDDDKFKQQVEELKVAMPFAVCGADEVKITNNKKRRIRRYPWGEIDIDNSDHCDFKKLRTLLIAHMQDLLETTQESHYENYRAARLTKNIKLKEFDASTENDTLVPTMMNNALLEKDRLLQQKEEELKRMKQLLAQMQAAMETQK